MTRLAVVLIAHGDWDAAVKVSGLCGFLVPAAVVGDVDDATERVNRAQDLTDGVVFVAGAATEAVGGLRDPLRGRVAFELAALASLFANLRLRPQTVEVTEHTKPIRKEDPSCASRCHWRSSRIGDRVLLVVSSSRRTCRCGFMFRCGRDSNRL